MCVLGCGEMLIDGCILIPIPCLARSSQGVLAIFVGTIPFPWYDVDTGAGPCGCISKSRLDSSLFDIDWAPAPDLRRDESMVLGENGLSLSFCIVFRAKPQARVSVLAEGP